MTFPFPVAIAASGASPIIGNSILQYLTTIASGVDGASFTFSSAPIGAADANRQIFICVGWTNTVTISSVTVGGITALKLSEALLSGIKGAIYVASVPTGTTAAVVVTFSGSSTECLISLYKTTTASMILLDHVSAVSAGAAASLSLPGIHVLPGGFALGFCGNNGNAGSGTQTEAYTGTDTLVVDDERDSEAEHYSSVSVLTTETAASNVLSFTMASGTKTLWANGVSYFVPGFSAYAPVLADTFSDTTDTNTYTFTSKSIGTANSARQVLICFGWASTSLRSVTSVTVGGNAATLVSATTTGTTGGAAIYRIPVAAGTTATVVITMTSTITRISGGIYDTRPRSSNVPIDSGSNVIAATSVTAADIEVRAGGFLVCAGLALATGAMSAVYNGVDTLVKDNQVDVEALASTGLFSCLTTELASTNDPGFSTGASNGKAVAAASFL